MRSTNYPSPHSLDAPRCDAVDPDEGQRCQLAGRHVGKPHLAATGSAILSWGFPGSGGEVHRWPRHTIEAWIASAPRRPELRPAV